MIGVDPAFWDAAALDYRTLLDDTRAVDPTRGRRLRSCSGHKPPPGRLRGGVNTFEDDLPPGVGVSAPEGSVSLLVCCLVIVQAV